MCCRHHEVIIWAIVGLIKIASRTCPISQFPRTESTMDLEWTDLVHTGFQHSVGPEASRKRFVLLSAIFLLLIQAVGGSQLHSQCPPGSWVLTGQVVDESGTGIAGLDLDLADAITGLALPLSGDVTLADGSFSMTVCQLISPGTYLLSVNPEPDQLFFAINEAPISVTGSASLGLLTLETAAILTGRVIGESFEALPQVDLDFTDALTGLPQVFSGDYTIIDGTFSTKVVPGFWDVQFTASPASTPLQMVPRELRDVLINDITDLGDVRLREGRFLTGTVLNPVGVPVVNADVDARDLITDEKIVTPGDNTNSAGVFGIWVPAGQLEIEIDPPNGSTLVPLLQEVIVPVTGLNLGILTMEEGVAVSGVVVDATSTVVPGVDLDFIISATGLEIPTADDNANSSGQFSVQVVPDTYDIAFRPSFVTGLAPLVISAVSVVSNTDLGTVILPQGSALTGTILAGGLAVEGAEIELLIPASGQNTYLFGNDTDGLGAFALRQTPGIYDLRVVPPVGSGYPIYDESGVDLSGDLNLSIDLLGGPPPTPPNPVNSFTCCCPGDVVLQWVNGDADYDLIQILRQGSFLTNLPGDATGFVDVTAPPAFIEYQIIPIRSSLTGAPAGCTLDNAPVQTTPPVENLACEQSGSGVVLSWSNASATYDEIEIYQDGVFLSSLPGDATTTFVDGLSAGIFQWELIAIEGGLASSGISCTVTVVINPDPIFIRGNANGDVSVNVADAITILEYLFSGGATPDCLSSLDVNDSGAVNIADGIHLLGFLFSGGVPPELPYPDPGEDPTPDSLPCN